MKSQWMLILGLLFALLIAVFAVFNVRAVEVNYLFGTASIPLILVILFSTLFGGLAVGLIGLFRFIVLQRKVKQLEKQLAASQSVHTEEKEADYLADQDVNETAENNIDTEMK